MGLSFRSTGALLELDQAIGQLEQQRGETDPSIYATLLEWCGNLGALEAGKRIHEQIARNRKNRYVENLVIKMYGKCGAVEAAREVLDSMGDSNVFSWTIMVAAYAQNGHLQEAIECFHRMELEGVRANRVTIIAILGACESFSRGKLLHARAREEGFLLDRDLVMENALLGFYGRCRKLEEAEFLFEEIGRRKDLVSWTAMMSAFVRAGHPTRALACFRSMQVEGIKPCCVTFAIVLEAATDLKDLRACEKEIHVQITEAGLEHDDRLLSSLVKAYGKCDAIEKMSEAFDKLGGKNVISWTATIAAYAQNGYSKEAMEQLQRMDLEGMRANEVTFVSVLDACAWTDEALFAAAGSHPKISLRIADRVLQNGFEAHPVVATALVNLFGKLGRLEEAKSVFDTAHAQRDTVSWNSIMSATSQNEQETSGTWRLFQQMDLEGFYPDRVTLVTLLDSCANSRDLRRGRQVHEFVVASEMDSLPSVANCIVNMYGKCGSAEEAKTVFESLCYKRDVVSWNVMLSTFVQAADNSVYVKEGGRQVQELRKRMHLEGVKPNAITFVSMVDAAAVWEELEEGELLHARIVEAGYGSNAQVCNSLVNMYGKCHSLERSKDVFRDMQQRKNEISWSSLVAAYAQNNRAETALALFQKMDLEGLKSDRVTFISVLDACGDLKASKQSKQICDRVLDAGLESDIVVANALMSMHGKLGNLEEASSLFNKLPEKSVVSWNTMVVELAKAGRSEAALEVFRSMSREGMTPSSSSFVAALFACGHSGLVEQGRDIFLWMVEELGGDLRAEHYGCIVDLLGRSGKLDKAEELIDSLPFRPDSVVWNMLLASSQSCGDVDRAKRAAKEVLRITSVSSSPEQNPKIIDKESPFVALSNALKISGRD